MNVGFDGHDANSQSPFQAVALSLLAVGLSFQRLNFNVAARRQDGDSARTLVWNDDPQRLTVAFEQRDVTRFRASSRKIEQRPLVRAWIVFGNLIRAPKIGPQIVAFVHDYLLQMTLAILLLSRSRGPRRDASSLTPRYQFWPEGIH